MKLLWLLAAAFDVTAQFYFHAKGYGSFNSGISFGLKFSEVQILIALLCLIVVFLYIKYRGETGVALILAGGLGNLIPRIIMSGVQDYIFIPFVPVWLNFSDILIAGGVLIYMWNNKLR